MKTRRVGTSGLSVSRLGLGTMTGGADTPIADARAKLRAFVEAVRATDPDASASG